LHERANRTLNGIPLSTPINDRRDKARALIEKGANREAKSTE
jgi:hypothetical protein